jgi:hypothetical protein
MTMMPLVTGRAGSFLQNASSLFDVLRERNRKRHRLVWIPHVSRVAPGFPIVWRRLGATQHLARSAGVVRRRTMQASAACNARRDPQDLRAPRALRENFSQPLLMLLPQSAFRVDLIGELCRRPGKLDGAAKSTVPVLYLDPGFRSCMAV